MRPDIVPGAVFPDYELPDHRGKHRTLSELQQGDPLVLVLSRGGYCPKERRQHEGLLQLHREMQVGYCRLVTISTDNLLETNEFRAGVGAHWTFLSDPGRKLQKDLDIAEYTDPHHNPMIPHTLVLEPGLACLQDLQRLLVLRPADGGGAAPRPARRAAALPSRLGHQQRGAANRLGEGREGEFLSVRKNAGATVCRTGLIRSGGRTRPAIAGWCGLEREK